MSHLTFLHHLAIIPRMKQILTTTEAANILDMSQTSVQKMCDKKLIRSWRIPGSQHRRIPLEAVIETMRKLGYSEKIIQKYEPGANLR